MFISIGIGCKNAIGSLFIYILSYYKQTYSDDISLKNSTVFITLYTIPAAICALFSLKISTKFNINTYFRILSIIDTLSYLIAIHQKNFYFFLLFYSWIPNFIAYGLLIVPLMKNIWTSFSNYKG